MEPIHLISRSEIDTSYVKLVKINTSDYFDQCWLHVDPSSTIPIVRSTDPSFVYTPTESIIFGIGYIPLSIMGSVLNLLVMLAILKSPELRKEYLTPSIFSIALNDFIFSICTIPIASLLGLMRDLPLPFGGEFYGFVTLGLWQGSIFNLLSVAMLRCIAVFCPKICRTKKFELACVIAPALTWIFSMVTLLPVLTRQYGHFGFLCKEFAIGMIGLDVTGNTLSPHPFLIYMVVIIISGIVLIFLNIITFLQVSRKSRTLVKQLMATEALQSLQGIEEKILQKEKDLGKMVIIITGSFFIVFCPQIILQISDPYANITQRAATIITLYLACSLVVIDPIIYCVSHSKYREEILALLEIVFTKFKTYYLSIIQKLT